MRAWRTLTRDERLLLLNSVITGFGVSLYIYLQPIYIAQLGATPAEVGLTLSLSGLVVTVLYIPLGLWADRRGRKPMILLGWFLSGLATLGLALAPDWRWFIPALIVYLLSNFAVPALQGYVAAAAGPRGASRMFALLAAGNALGSVASPALGGWLGEVLGLRWVYGLAAVIFLLDTGLVLAALSPQATPPAVARASAPALSLLRNRAFVVEVLFILVLFVAVDLGSVLAPKYLEETRGLGVGPLGALGSLGTLGIAVLTLLLSRFPGQRRLPLVLAQGLAGAALVLWLRVPGLAFIALAYFIYGSNRLIRPLTASRLAARLGAENMSLGFGFYQTAQQLGLTLSPFLAGQLYTLAPAAPLYAGLVCLVLTGLLTLALPAA